MSKPTANSMVPFETPTLRLRPVREGDADSIFAMLSDPSVVRYIYDDPFAT